MIALDYRDKRPIYEQIVEKLEKLIMDFIYGEFDVLLSTTIVENGIDIPNANTIIINNAHH